MITESAVCLALDGNGPGGRGALPQTYGILTPSVAMGTVLRERLINKDIKFTIV